MYKFKNLNLNIQSEADSICINYWKRQQASAVITLQLGDGNYRLVRLTRDKLLLLDAHYICFKDGVGFNSIEIETRGKEFTAQVIYRKSNSDDVQSGIEFLLLDTLICERGKLFICDLYFKLLLYLSDIVRTNVKTNGCASDTSIAVLTSGKLIIFN